MSSDITKLAENLRQFAKERDWDQFHSPKNLACALSVETSEVLEHFQWLQENEALSDEKKVLISLELADVLLYLIRLADKLGIDLISSAQKKLLINAEKYPIDIVKGLSKKYSEY
jgi:dCTP diphosphatase